MERLYIGPSTKVEAHQKKAAWGLVRVWSTRDSLSVVTMEMEKTIIFSCSAGKESSCSAGDLGLIPGLGRFPGEGKGNPLHYSGLENSIDYT